MNDPQNREETIFEAALQLPPEQRTAHLKQACGDDAPLRQRVELLLNSHEQAGGDFLEKPRALGPNKTMVVSPPPPAEELLGTMIGRFKLLEKVGEGGFGVVYVAEQREPVKRRVALKIIKLGMDTKQVVARFEVERQALAMMDHPNIAKVFDAGATETGRPYFVMELVRGIRITDYCDQNNLSTSERLELFAKVCQAIQHAHQKGIIHRDIKPSNILVTLHDGVPVPKVIDFGIAKATQGELTEHTVYTQLQQFIGTPAYMSPEQAEMSGLDIDTRSDIYALGVLLYELLTGKTPFDQKDLLSAGIDGMRRMIREQEPQRPSTRVSSLQGEDRTATGKRHGLDAPKLVNLLQGDLDWIVMKCLEKDRTRRYETANGVAMDLQRHLSDEPVIARPPSAAYRLQKFARRNKLAFTVGTAIVAILVIATGVSTWQAVRATRAQALAKKRLMESEAITKFLTGVFQSPDPTRDGRTITVAETLDTAVKNLDRDLANGPAHRAHLQSTLGVTYLALGLAREAAALLEKSRDYHRAASGLESQGTLNAMNNLAVCYGDLGREDDALKLREEVLALSRKLNGPEHSNTLSVMNNLALSYAEIGRQDEARKLQEDVLTLRRKIIGPEHPDTLMAMNNLAISYDSAGRRDEALKLREEVLTLRRKVNGAEHPDTLMAMNNLAISYGSVGRKDEALKLREDGLRLSRKVNGPEHPDTLRAIQGLGVSYAELGRRDEALKLRENVLLLCRKVRGPEHTDTLLAMHNLAVSYSGLGRRDEALKLREEVMTLRLKVNGPEHPDTLMAMNNLAASYTDLGRRDEALKLREEVNTIRSRVLGPAHPNTLRVLNDLANSYAKMGKWREAAADFALAIKLDPTNHELYHAISPLLARSGDLEGYRQNCRQELIRFRGTKDANTAERMAKDCLILADSGVDLGAVREWAETAVTAGKGRSDLPWFQFVYALVEYRQGRFTSVEEWVQKVLNKHGFENRDVEAYMVLAMARQQLKRPDEARAALAQGLEIAERKLPKLESGDIGDGWIDWIIAHLLMREAKELIEGKPTDNTATP